MKKVLLLLCGGFLIMMSFMHHSISGIYSKPNANLENPNTSAEMQIFKNHDLLANQNFSARLEKIKASSFAGTSSALAKKANMESSALAKGKAPEKANKIKRTNKNKKDKKKKAEGESAETDVAETEPDQELEDIQEHDEALDTKLTTTWTNTSPVAPTETPAITSAQWLQTLLANPGKQNLDLVLQAHANQEITEADLLSIIDELAKQSGNNFQEAAFYLLSIKVSLARFQRLIELWKNNSKNSNFLSKVEEHLNSAYTRSLEGLMVLKQAALGSSTDSKLFASQLLHLAATESIKANNSQEDRVRGSSPKQTNASLIPFFQSLLSQIQSSLGRGDSNDEANLLLIELSQYLQENLPESREIGSREISRT